MHADGVEGEDSSLEDKYRFNGLDFEDDGVEEPFLPECGIIVPPPSHVMCERALQLENQRQNSLQWNQATRSLVDNMLNEVYLFLQPTKEQAEARRSVIQFVDSFVRQRIHGSHIKVFGSFVMDLYTGSSDLDLSLNVGHLQVERSRTDRISILRKLTRALHGLHNGRMGITRHTVRKIEPVMRAAVPVVKFVEVHTNIECDVSMENRDGVLKSEILGTFAQIDLRFRQLCFLLKAWAKAHNVNDSKKGTLNSLSIILLAAFHLQTRSPPILPSFSVLLEGLVLQCSEDCIAAVRERVDLHKKNGFGSDNKETLGQLFASFFVKLLAVESLWEQGLCVSVYEGKWVSKLWAKNHLGCMSVEDFAERSQNCARAVREIEFDIIHQSFRDTLAQLNHLTGSAAQVAELKHILFGLKSTKRISEEPLVQPGEKQLKVSNGWTNSMSTTAPHAGSIYSNPISMVETYGLAQPHQAVHSNHNRDLAIARHQINLYHGYQGNNGWNAGGENLQAASRGIISPLPGGQVQYFGAPDHNHMRALNRDRTGSMSFLHQPYHPPMGYPIYNAQQDIQAFHGGQRGPGMVGPVFYPPHPLPSEVYLPEPPMYRSDAGREHVTWQNSNGIRFQSPQAGHVSQTSGRRSCR